jgi:hypothetical protein
MCSFATYSLLLYGVNVMSCSSLDTKCPPCLVLELVVSWTLIHQSGELNEKIHTDHVSRFIFFKNTIITVPFCTMINVNLLDTEVFQIYM